MADLGLADPVDTPEPLLDSVRVPRQVVVDHQVRTLQVNALPTGERASGPLTYPLTVAARYPHGLGLAGVRCVLLWMDGY